jgi:hypothetical protein
MVTTCRRSAIGVGTCEFDLSTRCEMTGAEPELTIRALNSGSSSLKFGVYRVEATRIELLLSGEAESTGDKQGKFTARVSRNKRCCPRSSPFLVNGKRSFEWSGFWTTPRCRRRLPSGIGSCTVDQGSGATALLMMRFSANWRRRVRSRRCISHRLFPSSVSHESIFRPRRRQPASTPRFTPICRKSGGPFRFQGTAIGGGPTLRVSRTFVRIDRASTWGRSARAPDRRPPWQWRERHRDQGR